jgi:protein-arginine kinase activator protein McsA
MLCYSCNKQKNQLHSVKSNLIKGTVLLLCQTCIDSKFEPRWVVILAGRQFGQNYIKDYILKKLYVGRDILANELIEE